uniref:Uncharacterized protein n=1 Tax=Heterorhabditis bacteriophora TaxID=37862 RepID=A0A1I7X2S3_HETBA
MLQDKKPNESYGLQGKNHELPGTGKVHSTLPIKVSDFISYFTVFFTVTFI